MMIILGLVSLALQATLLPAFKLAGVKADFLIIILSIFALFKGPYQGAALGFTFGFLEDVYLGRYIGLNTLSMAVTGYVIGMNRGRLNESNLLVPATLAFFATVMCGMLVMFLGRFAGMYHHWTTGMVNIILPMAFFNGCLALLGYSLYQGGTAWITARKKKNGNYS